MSLTRTAAKGGATTTPGTPYGADVRLGPRPVAAHTPTASRRNISIRDDSGNFSCTLWNMFTEAADGWIEPWTETVARGTPHFHVDFGRAKNEPGTCTGYR